MWLNTIQLAFYQIPLEQLPCHLSRFSAKCHWSGFTSKQHERRFCLVLCLVFNMPQEKLQHKAPLFENLKIRMSHRWIIMIRQWKKCMNCMFFVHGSRVFLTYIHVKLWSIQKQETTICHATLCTLFGNQLIVSRLLFDMCWEKKSL